MQQRDTLTPLDARNSLLLDRSASDPVPPLPDSFSFNKTGTIDAKSIGTSRDSSPERLYSGDGDMEKAQTKLSAPLAGSPPYRPITPSTPLSRTSSRENLMKNAAPPPRLADNRQPTLPNLGGGGGGGFGFGGYGLRPPQPGNGFVQGGYGQQAGGGGYGQPYGRAPPSRGGY